MFFDLFWIMYVSAQHPIYLEGLQSSISNTLNKMNNFY